MGKHRTTGEAVSQQMIELYLSGHTMKQIAERFGTSTHVIFNRLKEKGISARGSGPFLRESWHLTKLTPDKLSALLKEYESGKTTVAVARKFGLDRNSVKGLLTRRGYSIRPRSSYPLRTATGVTSCHVHRVNERFFAKPVTEVSAYWLGFLLADGCVSDRGDVSLGLARKDRAHVESFKRDIKSGHPIKDFVSVGSQMVPAGSLESSLRLCSKLMANDLRSLECIPRKSLVHGYPAVPSNMNRHVIRGLFDGDGCLSGKASGSWYFSICGSEKCYRTVQKIIQRETGICPKIYQQRPRGYREITVLAVQGNRRIETVLTWLYRDAQRYLERKYELYRKFLNQRDFLKLLGPCYPAHQKMKKMTPENLKQAREMYESGLSLAVTAAHFGIHASSLHELFWSYKIPTRTVQTWRKFTKTGELCLTA